MELNPAINKASALVEALSYIQRFHNKVVVVKVGGSIMDDEQALSNLLTDIVFMNYVGMQPVLVHGGGKAINQAMETAGLKPQMVQGRRYTDERTLAIAEHVLCNQINKIIVNFVQAQGCEAMGLHSLSSVVLFAEKTYLQNPDGRRIDLGYVGEVTSVNARLLQLLVQADSIPCIATIARDMAGGRLNVNADTAAGAVAAAMKAEKLVVVSGMTCMEFAPTPTIRKVWSVASPSARSMRWSRAGQSPAACCRRLKPASRPFAAESPRRISSTAASPTRSCWKSTPKPGSERRLLTLRGSCRLSVVKWLVVSRQRLDAASSGDACFQVGRGLPPSAMVGFSQIRNN